MDCPSCGRSMPDSASFCGGCGTSLVVACPACGEANPADDGFCQRCGTRLAATRPSAPRVLEGERKQVTVLFADVVGFTALSERFDPETVREIMDGCFEILTGEIERYGGTVNTFTGDGLMALFGAPLAYEDHAARAVHTAWEVQQAMGSYAEAVQGRLGVPFQLRLGLNTGLVVVGAVRGFQMDFTAMGDTVNLAARIQQAAPAGGILVTEATWRAAGPSFEWRSAGTIELKGKADRQAAYELTGPSAAQGRFEVAAHRGLTRFVGRDRELDQLLATWEAVETGGGQVVSVVGEAGLGKSRLLHEFKTELVKRDVTVFEGSCFTFGEAISYLPFLTIVRGILGVESTDGAEQIESLLADHLGGGGLGADRPYLRTLLGLEPIDDILTRQPPLTIRQRTVEAVAAVILAASAADPMAVVVEDVHWIDNASEEVLSALVEAMVDRHLLVVLAYRPEYLHAWEGVAHHSEVALGRLAEASSAAMVRAILSRSYATQVSLTGLSPQDSRFMVRQLLGTADLPKGLEELIDTYTDGNPLFVEELTRHLIEAGHLVRAGDGYDFHAPAGGQALPTTVQDVLLARIDRLQPELRNLLQVASVLGRVFPHDLLRAMTDSSGGLDRALPQLEELDFVYPSASGPERRYSFKHVLTQEAVYGTLVRARREAHHERAGQAIEALYGDRLDEWVEILAQHYSRTGNHDKALHYLALAYQKAIRTCAVAEADGFFDQAMGILDVAPATATNEGRRIAMVAGHVFVAMWVGKVPAYFELLQRLADVAERLDDPILRRRFDLRIAQCLWLFGRVEEAIERLVSIVEASEADGDTEGLAGTYSWLMWAQLTAGNYEEVPPLEARALEVFEKHFDAMHYMWTRSAAAWALLERGAWGQAVAEGEAALRVGEEHGNDSMISFSAFSLCKAYTGKGQFDEALRYGDLALRKAPTPAEQVWSLIAIAQTWCRTGEADQAVEALESVVPHYEAQIFLAVLWNGTALGEAYLRAGRSADATATLQAVVDGAERSGMRFYLGSALRLLGECAGRSGSDPEAQRQAGGYFERAIAVLSEIGAENELALAHAGHGRLRRDMGDEEEARRHLRLALEIFERLGTLGEPDEVRKELVSLRAAH